MFSLIELLRRGKSGKRIAIWRTLFWSGFLGVLVLLWAVITQPMVPSGKMGNAISVQPSRLESHVRMLSGTLSPRDATHPENLDRVADYIRKEFLEAKGRLSEETYEADSRTYRNVIATFGPETGERIIVGAHYDSYLEQPAADDNASGVAGIIELAHMLGNSSPAVCVELVGFTLEEPPFYSTDLMGSAVHAAQLKRQGVRVRVMISLESIGYFSDAPDSQRFPAILFKLLYPSRANYILIAGRTDEYGLVRCVKRAMRNASSLPVYSLNIPRFVSVIELSDNLSFWNAGYKALMITDTAMFRNDNYHTPQDTPDTLDYRRMAMVVQGVYDAIIALGK